MYQILKINPTYYQIQSMIHSRSILLIFSFSLMVIPFLFANKLDSLESALEYKVKTNNSKELLDAYLELGMSNLDSNQSSKALEYLLIAESLSIKLKEDDLKYEIQYQKGLSYIYSHKYGEAISVLTKLIQNISGEEDKFLGDACYRLAKAYQLIGNNELAYEYQFKALQIREKLKDQEGIAYSLYHIGGIHFYQLSYHKAIEYYKQCLTVCENINHQVLKISCFGAIGGAYSRINLRELSLEYNLRAYDLSISLDGQPQLSYITFNLGDNYQNSGNFTKALDYFIQAHDRNIENNDQWGEISSTKKIGEIYIALGNENKGLGFLRESLILAQKLGARPIMLDVYISLATNLEKVGEFEEANKYYRNFSSLKDSLRNVAILQKMSDTKMQYEITKKEKDILKRDTVLQNMYRNFLILGLFALLVILYQVHSKYKNQAKHSQIQTEKNQQIQQQNIELEKVHLKLIKTNQLLQEQNEQSLIQNRKLERKNDELQRFAYIASHDLKEPLRNIGSFATLLKRRFKGELGEEADDYIDFITNNVSRMYDLLHEILIYSKLENEDILEELVSLEEVVSMVIGTFKGKIMEHGVDIMVANLPDVKGHKLHLGQLFQNLISNSIKYTDKKNPKVEIGIKEKFQGNDIVFFVKDNGIGIDMEFRDQVFEIFKRLHGKDDYEGTGVGLAICKKIVNQNNGEIWVESELGKGATFYFTLNTKPKLNTLFLIPAEVQGLSAELN